jgi:hypothetical protein
MISLQRSIYLLVLAKLLFHGTTERATNLLDMNTIPNDIKLALFNNLVKGLNQQLVELKSELVQVKVEDIEKVVTD